MVRLNDFLGLERSRELCEKIADACSFEKLKSASHNPEIKKDHFRNLWKEGSSGFFRKGLVSVKIGFYLIVSCTLFNLCVCVVHNFRVYAYMFAFL